jgi:hypothetical protein
MITLPSTALGYIADAAFTSPLAAVGEYARGVTSSRLVADVVRRPAGRLGARGGGRIRRVRRRFSSRPPGWGRSAPPPCPPAGGGGWARRGGAPPPPPFCRTQEHVGGPRNTGFLPEYGQAGGRSAATPPAPPTAGDFPPPLRSRPLTSHIVMHNLHRWPPTASIGHQPPGPSQSRKTPQKPQSGPRKRLVEPIPNQRSPRVNRELCGCCSLFRSFK